MTPTQRQKVTETRLGHALANLVGNPEFGEFINLVRELRERAIEDACMESTVANQRASLAAIGEVRAYKSILSVYEDYLARRAEDRGDAEIE